MRVRERERGRGERNRERERNLVAERGEKKALGFLTAAQPVCLWLVERIFFFLSLTLYLFLSQEREREKNKRKKGRERARFEIMFKVEHFFSRLFQCLFS